MAWGSTCLLACGGGCRGIGRMYDYKKEGEGGNEKDARMWWLMRRAKEMAEDVDILGTKKEVVSGADAKQKRSGEIINRTLS